MTVVEVFADVACPFTHVGLRGFVEHRAEVGRGDVGLRVRAWPLEIVNGVALDPDHIAEEVDDIRAQIAPRLFRGFDGAAFPTSSLPALDLAAAAYAVSQPVGERVSLELRDLLFEQGVDVADPDVLLGVAGAHGVAVGPDDRARVLADHAEGVERGVIGSPHFFTPDGGFFCPSLDVHRKADGHLRIELDRDAFDRFIAGCFA
jgi:predicted DsbA family dithiol-disulfide isomerase